MKQLFKFGLVLGVICLTSTLVLALTYQITKPAIDKELNNEEQKALKAILPEADIFKEKALEEIGYFEALQGSKLIGYCLKVIGNGYNGFIRIIVGIGLDGTIKGVRVLEQYETPGLGARINETRPGEKDPWFLRQFAAKPAQTVEVGKDIDAITGATVSSRAVADAVRESVKRFLDKMKK